MSEIPGVCTDVEDVREAPSLQCAWEGAFDYALEEKLWWWFINTFVCDLEERARIYRAAGAVRAAFIDVAKLHYAQTGEATPLPERLIRTVQMRVVCAMRPSAFEVATGAKKHSAARASAAIARLTKETAWQMRS
jgi:hypothetical protein